jgi:hypothetical protein
MCCAVLCCAVLQGSMLTDLPVSIVLPPHLREDCCEVVLPIRHCGALTWQRRKLPLKQQISSSNSAQHVNAS